MFSRKLNFFANLATTVRKHAQFLFFALIGIINTFIHGGILMFAVEGLRLDVTLSHLLAFSGANIFSYLMNSWLTFKAPLSFSRYARFFLSSMLALGLTLMLSWFTDRFGINYLVGFVLIIFLVPFSSFLALKFWAFSR